MAYRMKPCSWRPSGLRDCRIVDDDCSVPNPSAQPAEQARPAKATAEERATAQAIAAFIAKRRNEGASNTQLLIEIDQCPPTIAVRIVLAAHFYDLLAASGEWRN
jgi:hypothetical protein